MPSPVSELIDSYGVSYHQFADNTHLLVTMNSADATPAINRLPVVRLQLDDGSCSICFKSTPTPDKSDSEVVFLGIAAQLRSVTAITTVDVA